VHLPLCGYDVAAIISERTTVSPRIRTGQSGVLGEPSHGGDQRGELRLHGAQS